MSELEKEFAKASGQVLVETAGDARRALGDLFGEAAHELAHIFGDSVKLWRIKNLLRIRDEVHRIATARGIPADEIRALPIGDAVRIAEGASCEDEPELQELWARLIANVTTGPEGVRVERAFVEVLKAISPAEAALLDMLWTYEEARRRARTHPEMRAGFDEVEGKALTGWRRYDADQRRVAVQNLFRMRCIAVDQPRLDEFDGITILRGGTVNRSDVSEGARRLRDTFRTLVRYVAVSVGGSEDAVDRRMVPRAVPELMYKLTPLGSALMRACRARDLA